PAGFCEAASNGVGSSSRRPLHPCFLARPSIGTGEIGAACVLSDKPGNINGISLQIAIDENCGGATGGPEASINTGALSPVFFETNHLNIWCRFDSLDRSINRSIVHKNDFVIESTQRCAQLRL